MFRFTIRDLVLLTVIVALAVAWHLDRDRLNGEASKLKAHIELLEEEGEKLRRPNPRIGPTFPYRPFGGVTQPTSSP